MTRASRRSGFQGISLETLEQRVLLDGGLGSELAQFASEDELASALVDRAVVQHEWMFNTEVNPWRCVSTDFCPPEYVLFDALDGGAPANPGAGDVPVRDFSDTNVQVAGVDEGDLVETDGHFVYILSDQMVSIVDVRKPAHPRVASRVQLDPSSVGREMYLHEDRLLVLSSNWYYSIEPIPLIDGGPVGELVDSFAADAWWAPSRSSVMATVIDVTDRENANVVSTTEIDGSLSNSRAIDGTAYLIVDDYLSFPMPETKEIVVAPEGEEPETIRVYESEEEYRSRIADDILEILPDSSTYDVDDRLIFTQPLASHDSMYRTKDPHFHSLVSIVTIDMQDDLPSLAPGTTVMTNSAHEIFMSTESLYLFQTKWGVTDTTSIMQFDVDMESGSATPVASGVVNGRMLDQFSADEDNGQLRIATTTGFGDQASSGVYVLDDVDDQLSVIGYVDELALGEQIFLGSIRGRYGLHRDISAGRSALFAISLAVPEHPTVEGELKIPGFSEYLQPMGDSHLLAIGRDADPVTGRAEALAGFTI